MARCPRLIKGQPFPLDSAFWNRVFAEIDEVGDRARQAVPDGSGISYPCWGVTAEAFDAATVGACVPGLVTLYGISATGARTALASLTCYHGFTGGGIPSGVVVIVDLFAGIPCITAADCTPTP